MENQVNQIKLFTSKNIKVKGSKSQGKNNSKRK